MRLKGFYSMDTLTLYQLVNRERYVFVHRIIAYYFLILYDLITAIENQFKGIYIFVFLMFILQLYYKFNDSLTPVKYPIYSIFDI